MVWLCSVAATQPLHLCERHFVKILNSGLHAAEDDSRTQRRIQRCEMAGSQRPLLKVGEAFAETCSWVWTLALNLFTTDEVCLYRVHVNDLEHSVVDDLHLSTPMWTEES